MTAQMTWEHVCSVKAELYGTEVGIAAEGLLLKRFGRVLTAQKVR